MQFPPPVRTDGSNAFAHNTMAVRVPNILLQTLKLNPDYPPLIQDALKRLHDDLTQNVLIRPLPMFAPDYHLWLPENSAHEGDSWLNTVWFYAETYFYRRLIEAVRWWETGHDPFAPKKAEEYAGTMLWELLERAIYVDGSIEDRLYQLLLLVLWGNRIDLSYAASLQHGSTAQDGDLMVDERDAVIEQIMSASGPVHLITDNAGSELAMDCALVNVLLDGIVDQVILHVKMHPTFVSDATTTDVIQFWQTLASGQRGDAAKWLGERLIAAFEMGRIRLAPHFYWNSSHFGWELPDPLARTLREARLVILKGDANYRRFVGDAIWNPTTPFSSVLSYSKAPVVALRTLKSDTIVGLPNGLSEHLDSHDPDWRINGRRGVIQFSPGV